MLKTINRTWQILLGAVLVALTIPHRLPTDMTYLSRRIINDTLTFRLALPLLPTPLYLTSLQLLIITGMLCVLAVVSVSPAFWRRCLTAFRTHQRILVPGILALELFAVTMVPSEPSFVASGPAVILYLLFSSLGLLFLGAGLVPLLPPLSADGFWGLLTRLYEFLRRLVLASPLVPFLAVVAGVEFLLANACSWVLFQHIPHIEDSAAQLFHATIFSHGALTAPAPPFPEFFEYKNMIIHNGAWYSQYPPGHTVLLMLGVLVRAPWIINPLFGSLTIPAIYALGKELHGDSTGRIAALLFLLSPFVLFMNSEFMNHTTSLFFFTIFLLFFVKALRSGRFLHGAIAGGALGWVILIRSYTAAGIAFPFLLYGLVVFLRHRRELLKAVTGFFLFLFLFIGLLLAFNTLTNGSPLLFGFQVLWGPGTNPGFGHSVFKQAHTPLLGIEQTISNFNGMNKYLFEWPVPSLLLVLLVFLTGTRDRWDFLFLTSFLTLAFAYFFYWFQDWCFGPRFLFETTGMLVILAARSIERIPELWNTLLGYTTPRRIVRVTSVTVLLFLFGLGFATNIPPHLDFYGKSYWGVNNSVIKSVQERHLQRALIFVRSSYGGGFIANDPFLRENVFYVRDLGAKNEELMKAFPGYQYYIAFNGELYRTEPR